LAYCEAHNLILDETLRPQDLGVSGFRGDNAAKGALKGFLDAIESGHVRKGSVLIVESLDRLSRNHVMEAMELWSRILRSGVLIITLNPEREYSVEAVNKEPFCLLEAILIMIRSNEESETKAMRVRSSWEKKTCSMAKQTSQAYRGGSDQRCSELAPTF
jgi:DNA invertase Pin-like site-specific DNA recombinase